MTEPRFRRYTVEERSAMLIEAGLACLARGGIQAFTVDNICREAKASRGADRASLRQQGRTSGRGLYVAAYRNFMAILMPDGATDLKSLIDAAFSADLYRRDPLNIWLALWGEVAVNPDTAGRASRAIRRASVPA
jgi:TetR/AcrR family transcriptional regulator, transcriptional repressor of bet genes